MSFDLLPAEILQCILGSLDGVSFCVAKQVCKRWSNICKQVEADDEHHWRTLCIREIPVYVMEELLAYNSVPSNQSVICWFSLYRRWAKGKISPNMKDFKKTSIEASLTNPITVVRASGIFVITGHNNGFISVWNHETGELDQEFKCHSKTITDIVLLDQVNLGSYLYRDELFWSHHHVITVSKDCMIRVKSLLEPLNSENDILLNKHGDIVLSARVFDDRLFVFSRCNTISFWKLRTYYDPLLQLDVQYQYSVIGPGTLALCVGVWYNQLFCVSKAGNLQIFNDKEYNWSELTYFQQSWRGKGNVVVVKCYNFRNKVIVLITAAGNMIISVNEETYRLYGITPFLRTSITSVTLKGTLLAIGGENGILYLFYVPDNESLVQITEITAKICLSEASIIAIDISFETCCPIVVASTTNSIHVVRLQKSGPPVCLNAGSNQGLASTST